MSMVLALSTVERATGLPLHQSLVFESGKPSGRSQIAIYILITEMLSQHAHHIIPHRKFIDSA